MGSRENEYDSDSGSEESHDQDYVPPANIDRSDGSDDEPSLPNMLPKTLKVFSVAMLPKARPELEDGGKIILPPSFLEPLQREGLQVNEPKTKLFKLTHHETQQTVHCGVLEFIAEEGKCYMPPWRMRNIGANDGDLIIVNSTSLPRAKLVLFKPQSSEFEDIRGINAVLRRELKNFACLTNGESIVIRHENRKYMLKILDTQPEDVVCIECDLKLGFEEFAAPEGPKPNKIQRLDTDQ